MIDPAPARFSAFTVALLLCAAAAPADPWMQDRSRAEREREIAEQAQPWTIQFEPSVWFVAPGGSLRMPGAPASASRVRLEELNLDSPRLSPYGELHVRTGEWRFTLSSFATRQSNRDLEYTRTDYLGPFLVSPGDRITTSIDFATAELSVGYRIPIPDALVGEGGRDFRGTLEAVGGLRLYSLGFDIQTPQGIVSYDDLLFEPHMGLKFTMEIRERFNVDVLTSIGGYEDGGNRRSYSYDIVSGFSYRPMDNVGIQVGYRNLAYNLSTGRRDDRFVYNGAVAGLFAGVVVRF